MTKATTRTIFKTIPITNANLWSIDFAAKERHRCLSRLGTLRSWGSRVRVFIVSRRNTLASMAEMTDQTHCSHQLWRFLGNRPWRDLFSPSYRPHR